MLYAPTATAFLQVSGRRLQQAEGVAQLAAGQESGIGGDGGATEFQTHPLVKGKLRRGVHA